MRLAQGFELVPKMSGSWVPSTRWVWGGPRCPQSVLFTRAAGAEYWTWEGAVGSAHQNLGNPRNPYDPGMNGPYFISRKPQRTPCTFLAIIVAGICGSPLSPVSNLTCFIQDARVAWTCFLALGSFRALLRALPPGGTNLHPVVSGWKDSHVKIKITHSWPNQAFPYRLWLLVRITGIL